MAILLVTYELAGLAPNQAQLLAAIKATQSWARLGSSAYLVSTIETPQQLRDRLQPYLRANDRLWVGIAPAPSAWYGLPNDVSDWIVQNQT